MITKKKTPVKRERATTLKAIYDLLSSHHWVSEPQAFEKLMKDHIADQTRLIEILLARCDAQDKAIGKIELHVHKIDQNIGALTAAYVAMDALRQKQDRQIDRLIKIDWLMMRELQRFCKTQLEPATVKSIRRDLHTPELKPIDPPLGGGRAA
jgi:hypothetical protein